MPFYSLGSRLRSINLSVQIWSAAERYGHVPLPLIVVSHRVHSKFRREDIHITAITFNGLLSNTISTGSPSEHYETMHERSLYMAQTIRPKPGWASLVRKYVWFIIIISRKFALLFRIGFRLGRFRCLFLRGRQGRRIRVVIYCLIGIFVHWYFFIVSGALALSSDLLKPRTRLFPEGKVENSETTISVHQGVLNLTMSVRCF